VQLVPRQEPGWPVRQKDRLPPEQQALLAQPVQQPELLVLQQVQVWPERQKDRLRRGLVALREPLVRQPALGSPEQLVQRALPVRQTDRLPQAQVLLELDSPERERQRDPQRQELPAFRPLGLESPGHQTDLLPPERRVLPEQLVVRPGPGLRHQTGQRAEQLRVRQTDQPPEQWPRARQEFVFRCRPELRVLAAARCGASRPRSHALIHSGVAWPLVDFERGRHAP